MKSLKKAIARTGAIASQKCKPDYAAGEATDKSIAENPGSNTGLNSQSEFSVGLDWLDLTFRKVPDHKTLRAILADIEALTNDVIDFSPDRPIMNGCLWDGSGLGALGTRVWWQGPDYSDSVDRQHGQLKIAMSGSILAGTNQHALAYYLSAIAPGLELDCTRLDIALDDHNKFIELGKITEAREAGNYFNASRWQEYRSGKRGQDEGISIYFGSPQSDKRLCIYDKGQESNGRIQGNRWEGRFRRKAAKQVLLSWLNTYNENRQVTARFLQNTVLGIVDFRDRLSDDANRDRCPQLPWYRALCNKLSAKPARIVVEQVKQTAQKTIDWVEKAVAPSIATLKTILGDDFPAFFSRIVAEGGERLTIARRKIIEQTEKEQLAY